MELKHRPNWWLAYLTVPMMIGMLLLEGRFSSPPEMHRILEMGIVLVTFGLIALWVHANESFLLDEQTAHESWVFVPPLADGAPPVDDGDATTPVDQSAKRPASDPKSQFVVDPDARRRTCLAEDPTTSAYHLQAGSNKGRYN